MRGNVKFFDDKKGFGFIMPEDGGPEVFVHRTGMVPPLYLLQTNDVVTFEVEQSHKGNGKKAVNVERA